MSGRIRRPNVEDMFERIVVAYAGDRAGRDAVLLACRLAAAEALAER